MQPYPSGARRLDIGQSAHAVSSEGTPVDSVRFIEKHLQELGCSGRRIVIKGDQEPSINVVQEIVAKSRTEGATTIESSPVSSSQSNGAVERAIQAVQGQIRTFKDMVETHLKKTVSRKSVLFKWLVDRYRVTESGRSAFGNI